METQKTVTAATTIEKPAPLKPELVREFVVNCHGDLDRARELLELEPVLLNACWDWGGGDWETGLGGASHMGRADIAEFLLSNGARLDIFAAAMLGRRDVVESVLRAYPATAHALGPHGIPLIAHAKAGGPAGEEVVALLQESPALDPLV